METESVPLPAGATVNDDNVVCRVCGSDNVAFVCKTPNEHGSVEFVSRFSCAECGAAFIGNELADEELDAAYASLGTGDYYKEIGCENREKMRTAVTNLKQFAGADAAIIDIGTGNGEFLKVLHEAGFKNISGHEIPGEDLTEVEPIAKAIYLDHDHTSVPSGSFDVATMLDVVEHVRDPQYLLEQCFRILKPGGHIYFHTPVVTRTDRMMQRIAKFPTASKIARTWLQGRTSIFHLQNYSETSIRILLERSGFTLKSFQIKNELSWPVGRYVQVYLIKKLKLPQFAGIFLTPVVYPLIATSFFNANKSIVLAQKP